MVHPTLRRCLFWCHLAVGVVAGLVILILAVTGILMSFETQIVGKAESGIVSSKQSVSGTPAEPEALIGAWKTSGLQGTPTALVLSSDPADPAVFQMGRQGRYLFHPVSGEALGKGAEKTRRFFQIVVSIHRWITWPAQRTEGAQRPEGGMRAEGQAPRGEGAPRAEGGQRGEAPGESGQGGEVRGGEADHDHPLTWRTIGGQITSGATLVFGFLLLSGLVLWVPKKLTKKAFKAVTLPQTRLKGRARDWNWHNIAGFWFAPFILLIVLTGLVMAYPWANKLMFNAVGESPPQRQGGGGGGGPGAGEGGEGRGMAAGSEGRPEGGERRRRDEGAAMAEGGPRPEGERRGPGRGERRGQGGAARTIVPTGFNNALAAAKRDYPEWKTISLELAGDETKPIVATVSQAGRGRPDLRVKLSIDRATSAITVADGFDKLTLGSRLRQLTRWIHTGEVGGIGGQIVALLTCISAVVLVYTGFALSWRRLAGFSKKRKEKKAHAKATAATPQV